MKLSICEFKAEQEEDIFTQFMTLNSGTSCYCGHPNYKQGSKEFRSSWSTTPSVCIEWDAPEKSPTCRQV